MRTKCCWCGELHDRVNLLMDFAENPTGTPARGPICKGCLARIVKQAEDFWGGNWNE